MSEESPKSAETEAGPKPAEPAVRPANPFAVRRNPLAMQPPRPFLYSAEFKRIVFFMFLAVAMLGVVFQIEWNKKRVQADVEEDRRKWKEQQDALASSGPGEQPAGGTVVWDNMLADEKDEAPLDDVTSDKGYKYLIRHLANLKPGEGLGKPVPFDYVDLVKNPAKNRGRVVSLAGLTNKIASNIRLESNQGPFDSVYRLYVVNLAGTQSFIVDVLERPDGLERRDALETEGIFIRTHKYENERGHPVEVPFFVARAVKPLKRETVHREWSRELAVAVGVIALAIVVVVAVAGRQRQKPKPKQA
jgi:hypothetical protein